MRAEQEVVFMRRAWIAFADTRDDVWRLQALAHLRASIVLRRAHRDGQRLWREHGVPVKVTNEYCIREAARLAPGAVHAGRRGLVLLPSIEYFEISPDDLGAKGWPMNTRGNFRVC